MEIKELLLSNTFTVVPSIRYGISQKNNADILLVVDALEVAYTNPLIDSFCIVSGDSDYTPLVGRLKAMGKFVLGISRSEVASSIFINACNEFQFLESVKSTSRSARTRRSGKSGSADEPADLSALGKVIESILTEQADEDGMFASELKGVLLRLQPDFNEKAYGCATFGKLLNKLAQEEKTINVKSDNFNVVVSLNLDAPGRSSPQISAANWKQAFQEQLDHYKDDGFERINPSILKADIQAAYPDFQEKSIGFKRFSDLLKELERSGILKLDVDEQKNLLVRIV